MPESNNVNILLPGKKAEELVLTFAGRIVRHLGVQMYAGRPVPAIAELISNAWDADAKKVNVEVPLDQTWNPANEQQTIKVEDNGNGMTWEMVRDSYLDVGRDRRESEHTDRSPGGRLVQGRKGIGKLAGFGIADIVEIQTINKDIDPSTGEQVLIWFSLSMDDLKKIEKGPAPAKILYAGPVSKSPPGARISKGTTVILKRLHERRAQNKDRFHKSMAQRFLLMGDGFTLTINGEDLKEEHFDLQWRWPETGWSDDNVEGCGPVQYWIGFTPQPRKQNEGDLSGILVYTRKKISQEATFFDISGGVTGQHGLRYLVGMVKAEWLDAGIDAPDHIATHRGAIAWESPSGQAFQKWGQKIIKEKLAEWAKLRSDLRKKEAFEFKPEFKSRIEQLSPAYQKVAYTFIERFRSIEMEVAEFNDLLEWFLSALENATLRNIIVKLRNAQVADLEKLDILLSKMHIRIAVSLLQILDSNLGAIDALEKMHLENAKERGVISKHLENNPWLLNPTWMLNRPEGRVSKWIEDEFNLPPKGEPGDEDRADFFCVGVGGTLHIVEIKRGRYVAKNEDILQANKYREYVKKRFDELSDPDSIKYGRIQSHLIAAELNNEASSLKDAYRDRGWVMFTTWDDLIARAKLSHQQYRKILEDLSKKDASVDDVD